MYVCSDWLKAIYGNIENSPRVYFIKEIENFPS